jgi:ATP-binding cassette subfamily B protein
MMFLGNLSFVFVSVVGAILVFNGHITFGVIAEFMIYIRLFTHPLGELSQQAMTLQMGVAGSNRIFEFLEEEEMENEDYKTDKLKNIKGEVIFDRVHFSYKPGVPVIKNFSANVSSGKKIAIVGPTGAGKTTIVNLLMRFYEVDSGFIAVDEMDLRAMKREDVYDLFCMVLQDTWLFEGTVKENIIYNKRGKSEDDVKRVCKAVRITPLY